MEDRLLTTAYVQFAAYRHSALLAATIAAFAVRPLIGGGLIVFSAALAVLIALFNINVMNCWSSEKIELGKGGAGSSEGRAAPRLAEPFAVVVMPASTRSI